MSEADAASADANRTLVLKNTAFLMAAQAVGMPLSILVNGILGRNLGPKEFGELYLATTFATFGFLFVEWGQGAVLTLRIAQERARAGELLGSSLAFRITASGLVGAMLVVGALGWGYAPSFATVLVCVIIATLFTSLTTACQDALRGFERTDFAAASYVGYQILAAIVVIPTVILGGRLGQVVIAQAICAGVGLAAVWFAIRKLGVTGVRPKRDVVRELVKKGTPFLGFGIVMALQPSIDALFLSRLASEESIGWHAAARRLIGVLVYPAGALISALYPTLSRLFASDKNEYAITARAALRTTTLLAVPMALACALFPDVGVRIFSLQSFGPAEDNLRVMSAFLFLLYFSMPLGCALAAAGREVPWTFAQSACVAVSVVLDPLLIRRYQASTGNGGLGVCIAGVLSEVLMVVAGLALIPKGVLDRTLLKRLLLALIAGGAMAGVAISLSFAGPFVAAPVSLLAYGVGLVVTGGIEPDERRSLVAFVRRKLRL